MNYIELTYIILPKDPWADIIIAVLAEEGFESFEETEDGFKAYISGDVFDEKIIQRINSDFAKDKVDIACTVKKIDDTNWNQVWESNFEPVMIADCYIRAPFHDHKANSKFEIIIEPKMSFGTGHHETTSLMVKWMLELDFSEKSALDMGCGTGVLAILASKLGAYRVTAIDNYIFAYENTVENIERNSCNNIIAILGDASELSNETYDIIITNITKNVLIQDMEAYKKVLAPSGLILFSGFFTDDKADIEKKATELNLRLIGEKQEKEWCSLCFKNN